MSRQRRFAATALARMLAILALAGLGAQPGLAAEAEKAAALRAEAALYEHGDGVARDPEMAARLYCEAARLGDVVAQYNLGWMYANGRDLARDDATAAWFFGMAARQGDALAARMLRQVGEPPDKPPECLAVKAEEPDPIPEVAPEHRQIADLVRRLSPEYGVHPRLAMAIIRAESNFDALAISPKNAQGLMQLIPETAQRFNVRRPFDPEQNIRGGLSYLRWLLAYFKGDVTLVAAAYNAGERTVDRFRGIPPYPETRGYVRRIREIYKQGEHPFDPAVTQPSPELPRITARRLL